MPSRIRRAIGLSVALVLLTSQAIAQSSATVAIDLPQQPLAESLHALGKRTETNILIDLEMVKDLQAPALKADLTVDEAISRLLAGTGIRHRFIDARTVVLSAGGGEKGGAKRISREAKDDGGWRVAQAQTGTEPGGGERQETSPGEGAGETLAEIVVTAQKRKERLIDTPQSLTVLSADALQKLGAVQFKDYANTVPGLSFTTRGAGYSKIVLRGVTTGASGDTSGTVGNYVDEVPYGSSTSFAWGNLLALDAALFDLDRIEILRGPQGTLYGASTMGGLLKYVTRQPDTTGFGVDVRAGLSSTDNGGISYNGAAVVNVPLSADKAALRVSGFESHDGGSIDNLALNRDDVDRSDIYGGRADLLFMPTEALSIRVTGFLQNITRDGIGSADYTFTGAQPYGTLTQNRQRLPP